jgi:hypothetical protein
MKLVPDARRAWRWFSVQAMTLAIAIQGAWAMLTPQQVDWLPEWVPHAVTTAILILGIIGRLIDQGDTGDGDGDGGSSEL